MTAAFVIHAHPNLNYRNYMDDTLNLDLVKIELRRTNRVEFNARKTQCCLLSHKRISDPGQNDCMGGMVIAKSATLDVLGTSIRSDPRWDDHIFNAAKCLGFLQRCKKYFTTSDLRTIYVTYIRPKM